MLPIWRWPACSSSRASSWPARCSRSVGQAADGMATLFVPPDRALGWPRGVQEIDDPWAWQVPRPAAPIAVGSETVRRRRHLRGIGLGRAGAWRVRRSARPGRSGAPDRPAALIDPDRRRPAPRSAGGGRLALGCASQILVLAARPASLVLGQGALAEPDRRRRHLDELVARDELDRRLEGDRPRPASAAATRRGSGSGCS